jgi:calcineurin-like phosphoesterase family protein
MSNIYFTSDTHFGHKLMARIRGFAPGEPQLTIDDVENQSRLFDHEKAVREGIANMDDALIQNWNRRVQPGDVIYHLGDFSFAPAQRIEQILMSLKGRIHLFIGNHDKELKKVLRRNPKLVEWVGDYKEIKAGEQFIVLNHYPYLVWNKSHYGSWNLHGHCHGSLPINMNVRQMDVGVDSVGQFGFEPLTPISLEEVAKVMASRKFVPVDRHGAGY